MSNTLTPAAGVSLLRFRLVERIGATVWKADDTSSGKTVAIKFLTRQLPRETARRDTLIRQIRLGAALYHTNIVPIIEIAPADEMLLMVMEFVDAQPLTRFLGGAPTSREMFFKITYQIAEALKLLHGKNIIHGNLNGDSILVGANGHVRVAGLNVSNVLQRGEGPTAYQMKGADPRSVAYMAPEQITSQNVDHRADIFSLGTIMYELATGRNPFAAPAAADIARLVVEGNPPSPKTINPAVDTAVLNVLAPCLFKDMYKRQRDAKAVQESIGKVAPDAVKFTSDLATIALAAPAAAPADGGRQSLLLIADIAHYDEMSRKDPAAAARAAARLQQVVGEAAFLFDGTVVDPFGPRVIAEMPTVEAALEAARKSEFDFSPAQQEAEPLGVRLLLHAGEVVTRDGNVVGDAVDKAQQILNQSPALTLHISEEFMKKARGSSNVRVRDAGAKAGVKMYTIVPAEPPPPPEISTAEIEAQEAAEAAAEAEEMARKAARKKRTMIVAAGLAAVILAVVVILVLSKKEEPIVAPVVAARPNPKDAAPTAANPKKLLLDPFVVEVADPALTERGNSIRLATIEMLRAYPELRVAEAAGSDVESFSAKVRVGAAGPEIAPLHGGKEIAAFAPLADAASGMRAVLQPVTATVKVPPRVLSASSESMNAFADAVSALSAKADSKAEASIRASISADPNFLPAQLLAVRFFSEKGKRADAVTAMKAVIALDGSNLDVARSLARLLLEGGEVREAFSTYSRLLAANPADPEVLGVVARYAASIGDTQRFSAAVARLRSLPPNEIPVHEPDILVLNGRMENAVDRYYDIETNAPNNPALALKIGRIAVLRRTLPIAELELKKLEVSDSTYGHPLLRAYMAAQAGDRAAAEASLKTAQQGSRPGDDYWTSVAEIYAILADGPAALAALEKAVARKEPTINYVLRNPLFTYLESEDRFQTVKETLTGQVEEIRVALGQVAL